MRVCLFCCFFVLCCCCCLGFLEGGGSCLFVVGIYFGCFFFQFVAVAIVFILFYYF